MKIRVPAPAPYKNPTVIKALLCRRACRIDADAKLAQHEDKESNKRKGRSFLLMARSFFT